MVDFRDNLEPVKDLNGTYATNAYVDVSKCKVLVLSYSKPFLGYVLFKANVAALSIVCKEKTEIKISFSSSESQASG